MSDKSLIIGATGFIGSAVMRQLLAEGEQVRVLARESSTTQNLDEFDVEVVHGDMRDRESVVRALRGCTTMYCTAAYFSHYSPDPQVAYDVNVNGTRATMQAAEAAGVERVVYTSTNCTLGAHGKTPVDESAMFNHWRTGDHYTQSKFLGEVEALRFAARGLPLVIVSPTYVIGTNDVRPTNSGQLLLDVAKGTMAVTMKGYLNVIDVEDVARGHILAARKGRIGENYLLGNVNISITEFQNMIADIAGVSRPRISIPYPLAVAVGHVSEAIARVTNTKPFETASAVKIGHMGESYDCSKAVTELGLPQTPIEDSIRRALEWWRAHGYL